MLGEFLMPQAFENRRKNLNQETSEFFPRAHVDMKGQVGVI